MLFHSVNGATDIQIEVTDRALNYGDGLFTTAKIHHGKVELLHQHLARLRYGCQRLMIDGVNFTWLESYLVKLASDYPLAVLKVLISAGSGGRGYSRLGVSEPNVVVSVHQFPTHYQALSIKGINLGVANYMLGINPQLAGIKHLNRLEQVLVRNELDNREEDDLLVMNVQQDIIETTSANVFYQMNGKWYTPELKVSGVDGLMRQAILANNNEITVCRNNLTALANVTAMFICNCIAGIIPVAQFNHTQLDLTAVQAFQNTKFQGNVSC